MLEPPDRQIRQIRHVRYIRQRRLRVGERPIAGRPSPRVFLRAPVRAVCLGFLALGLLRKASQAPCNWSMSSSAGAGVAQNAMIVQELLIESMSTNSRERKRNLRYLSSDLEEDNVRVEFLGILGNSRCGYRTTRF